MIMADGCDTELACSFATRIVIGCVGDMDENALGRGIYDDPAVALSEFFGAGALVPPPLHADHGNAAAQEVECFWLLHWKASPSAICLPGCLPPFGLIQPPFRERLSAIGDMTVIGMDHCSFAINKGGLDVRTPRDSLAAADDMTGLWNFDVVEDFLGHAPAAKYLAGHERFPLLN